MSNLNLSFELLILLLCVGGFAGIWFVLQILQALRGLFVSPYATAAQPVLPSPIYADTSSNASNRNGMKTLLLGLVLLFIAALATRSNWMPLKEKENPFKGEVIEREKPSKGEAIPDSMENVFALDYTKQEYLGGHEDYMEEAPQIDYFSDDFFFIQFSSGSSYDNAEEEKEKLEEKYSISMFLYEGMDGNIKIIAAPIFSDEDAARDYGYSIWNGVHVKKGSELVRCIDGIIG